MLMAAAAALVLGAYLLGATVRVIELDPSMTDDVRVTSMVVSGVLLGLGASLFGAGIWQWWVRQ